jgi:hypothetical protein
MIMPVESDEPVKASAPDVALETLIAAVATHVPSESREMRFADPSGCAAGMVTLAENVPSAPVIARPMMAPGGSIEIATSSPPAGQVPETVIVSPGLGVLLLTAKLHPLGG